VVLTAVAIKVANFWDVAPCGPYMNQCFGKTHDLHIQGRKSAEQDASVLASGLAKSFTWKQNKICVSKKKIILKWVLGN
jgi:hypothetical protein